MQFTRNGKLKILLCCIAVLIVAAACSPKGGEGVETSAPFLWNAGTTQEGSTGYVAIGAMAEVINRHAENIQMTPVAYTQSTAGLKAYDAGEVDSMFASMQQLDQYLKEYGPFDPATYKRTRPLALFAPMYELSYYAVIRTEDADHIKSWSDFAGKKVFPQMKGTGTYELLKVGLGPDGLDIWDELDIKQVDFNQSADALKLKEVDVVFGYSASGAPAAYVEETITRSDVRVIVPTPEELEKMLAAAPYFSNVELDGSDFSKNVGLTGKHGTLGYGYVYFVDPEMDEEVVYQATKALCENSEEMGQIAKLLTAYAEDPLGYSEKILKQAEALGATIHPGVKRYFAEQNRPL